MRSGARQGLHEDTVPSNFESSPHDFASFGERHAFDILGDYNAKQL